MTAGLGRAEIRSLLEDLDAELARRGAQADVFLVGGAAMALAYDAARSTRDLDAVFLPTDIVRRAAGVVAARHGLSDDWLNDAVKGFVPGPDSNATRYYDGSALTVDVASPRYLLAMKLFASRVEADADDIAFLYRQVGFTTVEQGLDLVEAVYRGRPVDPKVQYLLAEIVDSLGPAVSPEAPPSEASRALAAARRLGADAEAARRQMMAGARARRAAILEAHRAGMSVRKIAAELGCSPAVVQDAIRMARTETAETAETAGPDGPDGPDSSTGRPPAAGADGRPGTG